MTIIGSPPFLDNVIASWHLPWLRKGIFALPAAAAAPMQMVLTRDIGSVAAHILEHRESFVGERVDIATQAISGAQIKSDLEAASGRVFRAESKTFAELDPLLGKLFAGIASGQGPGASAESGPPIPRNVDLDGLRARLAGVTWSNFTQWAHEQDWDAILGARHV